MQKDVKFQIEDAVEYPEWCNNYPEHKFSVYKTCFLSTSKNSHKLEISDKVLRRDASSILGNMLVAKIQNGDATSHLPSEIQYGYFPIEQEIEFVESDGVTKAYAFAVVSKKYGKELNDIFEFDNLRNSSVEMTVTTDKDADDGVVVALDIFGLTVLGRVINGSCPDADIKMVRFSKEDAAAYFAKSGVKEEEEHMEEKKTYKVDKSKESMSTVDWGDVDKTALRNKIMDAENRAELVKDVYLLVEDGWEDAPSEHLKYPVMQFDGDILVYNRNALSAALAYAKQNDEAEVVNKIKDIYEKLDIDDESERKEEAAMEMEEVKNLADTEVEAESVLEEKEEETEVKAEEVCDNPDCDEHNDTDDHDDDCDDCKHDEEMSIDELKGRIAQLEKDVEDKDNIIMGKDAELAELRQFKQDVEDKEKAISVESIMAECKEFMSDETYKQMREEGMACEFAAVDAWANKVKAYCFTAVKKTPKKEKSDVFSFAAPVEKKEHKGLWD